MKNYEIIFQRVERELQIKGAGHLFSGPRNSIINQSQQQQQQQDPSETEALLPGMLNIDLPAQSTSPHGIFIKLYYMEICTFVLKLDVYVNIFNVIILLERFSLQYNGYVWRFINVSRD